MKRRGPYIEISPGIWSPYPQTREDALAQQIRFYHPIPNPHPCPRPGHEPASIIYTKTGISRCCAIRDAIDAYNQAIRDGEPVTAQDAIMRNIPYYYRPEEGKNCGHIGKTTISGSCFICCEEREKKRLAKIKPRTLTPRQRAIDAGEAWYMPDADDPCRNGHIAFRRVNNGECSECTGNKRQRAVKPFYEEYPDMIISRDDAKAMGLTAFRTGDPCRRGHRGWRYVSTKNCIECLKEIR